MTSTVEPEARGKIIFIVEPSNPGSGKGVEKELEIKIGQTPDEEDQSEEVGGEGDDDGESQARLANLFKTCQSIVMTSVLAPVHPSETILPIAEKLLQAKPADPKFLEAEDIAAQNLSESEANARANAVMQKINQQRQAAEDSNAPAEHKIRAMFT